MTTMNKLAQTHALRILACGLPGTGKTGALAALANAGYRLRILDFDGNAEPLMQFVDPARWADVDIVSLEDKMAATDAGPIAPSGTPKAFKRALDLVLREWAYTDPDGNEVNLGNVMSWTSRDILVLDSLTEMGEAAMRRALALAGRSVLNRRIQDWGTAIAEQDALISVITQAKIPCHVYVTAHLKQLNVPDVGADEDERLADLKLSRAHLFQDKLFPAALGQHLPPTIARHFPILLEFTTQFAPGSQAGKRIIRTVPSPAVDAKVPATGLPPSLPLDTGLLDLFRHLMKETAHGQAQGGSGRKAGGR